MPIRQDDNQPNRRFGIINLVLIGFGVLLLASSFLPSNGMQQVPRVPYSLFIDQVNDGAVKRAFITQDQIRYELSDPEEGTPPVLATTPIFDMDLPQRLETKGVEFAAAPPKKPNIFTTILSWVVPPLIFILVLQFFARRSMGFFPSSFSSFSSFFPVSVDSSPRPVRPSALLQERLRRPRHLAYDVGSWGLPLLSVQRDSS